MEKWLSNFPKSTATRSSMRCSLVCRRLEWQVLLEHREQLARQVRPDHQDQWKLVVALRARSGSQTKSDFSILNSRSAMGKVKSSLLALPFTTVMFICLRTK